MTWEEIQALAEAETESREALARKAAANSDDGDLLIRLARACVRDHKLAEALTHYDHAEFLGHDEAHAERRLVALHVGDFPEPDGAHA